MKYFYWIYFTIFYMTPGSYEPWQMYKEIYVYHQLISYLVKKTWAKCLVLRKSFLSHLLKNMDMKNKNRNNLISSSNCCPLRAAVLLNERPYTGVILWEAIRNLSHIAKVRFLIQIFGSSNSAEQLNNREIGTTSFSDLSHIDNECYQGVIQKAIVNTVFL